MAISSRSFRYTLVICLNLAGVGFAHAAETNDNSADLIKRGEYLAQASDCAACHTAPHGQPFAGGLAISSPVGTIYSTNITPSVGFGIGRYNEEQFGNALRRGIRADGTNLYPAMPYTSYSIFTDADVHALFIYFMQGVPAVDKPTRRTDLPFPMNIRASMKIWNLLFLNTKPFTVEPQQSEEWNRGAYLVEGAAHCSACHTPRGFLMQELKRRQLAGGLVGAWYAPNITSDVDSGIGSWTKEELVQYLRTGKVHGKAQAAGSMGEAVERSFQHLTDADLDAIAIYVRTVPAIHDPADTASRFVQGKAFSELAASRGRTGVRSDNANPTGTELFQGNCTSCHSAQAQGSKDGYYPSLFNNSALAIHNGNNLIAAILYGVNRTTSQAQAFMPGFGGNPGDANQLSNQEIMLLDNYVLKHYGRADFSISEDQVAEVRRGGPSSSLVTLARAGVIAGLLGLIAVLLIVGLVIRNRRLVGARHLQKSA